MPKIFLEANFSIITVRHLIVKNRITRLAYILELSLLAVISSHMSLQVVCIFGCSFKGLIADGLVRAEISLREEIRVCN
jgi:hypothetical protein